MEDYKIIIYIVLAILYFLFSGKKKSNQKKAPPVRREVSRNEPPVQQSKPPVNQPKPLLSRPVQKPGTQQTQPEPADETQPYSLEDILREFGQNMEGKTEKKYQEAKQEVEEIKYKTLEEPLTKIVDYDEDLKEEEQSLEKLAASAKNDPEPDQDQHFVPYALEKQTASKYAAMFSDPDGIRTAFIAGEIFNKKY